MLYAGLGYTERFPDYWELFSPTYGPDGTSDAFDKVKTEKRPSLILAHSIPANVQTPGFLLMSVT